MREAKSFGRSSILSRWGLYYCFTREAFVGGTVSAYWTSPSCGMGSEISWRAQLSKRTFSMSAAPTKDTRSRSYPSRSKKPEAYSINPVFGSKKHLINEWAISAFGPPSPSEAQSMVDRKGIRKRSYRSNKVFKATWSGFDVVDGSLPRTAVGSAYRREAWREGNHDIGRNNRS